MVVRNDDQCGMKHLKWAAIIVGVVMCITGGAIGLTNSMVAEIQPRMRKVEEQGARIDERTKAIEKTVDKIYEEGASGTHGTYESAKGTP